MLGTDLSSRKATSGPCIACMHRLLYVHMASTQDIYDDAFTAGNTAAQQPGPGPAFWFKHQRRGPAKLWSPAGAVHSTPAVFRARGYVDGWNAACRAGRCMRPAER